LLHGEALPPAADAALEALAEAVGSAPTVLRRRMAGAVCRRLHEKLRAAEADNASYRARRLARALATSVCALPRPHLSGAADSHKLVPLLLGWADLTEPLARGAVLHALRHCVEQLRAPEVQWHASLLLGRLHDLVVFRDVPVLSELVPLLFSAWRVALPGLAAEERRCETGRLVDLLQRELLGVSDKVEARRLYAAHLPPFLPQLGLSLCASLPRLVEGACALLDEEARGDWREEGPTPQPS